MTARFEPGDFLVFQLESGFGLLRVLAVDDGNDPIWHVSAFDDFYFDVESAEAAIRDGHLKPSHAHIALTDRAFESTQVAKLLNMPITADDTIEVEKWRADPTATVNDRSVRLMLGFR